MVRLNRIDTEKYRRMQENKTRERKAKKILSELGIKTATNPVSSPYSTDWKFDDGTDNPEDHRGKPVFGVGDDGQTFFEFPFVQKENVKDLFIAQDLKGGGGGWEHLSPEAKRRLNDKEYQNDVIKQVLEGTMSFSDGAQILQMEENEFEKFMNSLKPNEGTSDDKVKDLLIAPYNDINWR